MFAEYMFSVLHLGADRISQQISALRHEIIRRNGDLSAFNTPHLAALRRGLFNQPLKVGFVSSRRVPSTLEMILYVFDTNTHTSATWEQSAIATAIVLGFCCLLRPSEYLSHTGSDCHVLTADEVSFECQFPGMEPMFIPATELTAMRVTWEMVSMVRILFTSAKNIKTRWGRSIWFSVPTGEILLNLPKILFEWALISVPTPGDKFLSWPIPGTILGHRQTLRYPVLHNVAKDAAVHFGFSPQNFGCYSIRVGGATLLRAVGEPDSDILRMGRWKSLPACLGYQENSTSSHDRLLKVLLTQGAYSNRDLSIQYPRPRCVATGDEPRDHPEK
jgi:hypothetical protein